MDSEGFVREWTRSLNLVEPDRVYFAAPEHDQPDLPLIVFSRQGGPTYVNMDNPLIVWECWGKNKNEAAGLAQQLVLAIVNIGATAAFKYAGMTLIPGADPPTSRPSISLSWAKRYEVACPLYLQL